MKTLIQQNCVGEWLFESERPFAAEFNGPDHRRWQVPAFWVGGSSWRVRFAASETGRYSFHCPVGQGALSSTVPLQSSSWLLQISGSMFGKMRRELVDRVQGRIFEV